MFRKMMAAAGAAALIAALAGPALAQEKEWVWKTDGKRWTKTEELVQPFVMPKTQLVEVAGKEEGAFLGFKYTGKRMERVWFREVPRAEEALKAHECTWRLVYEKKQVHKLNLCLMNGAERPCPGMNPEGACIGMK